MTIYCQIKLDPKEKIVLKELLEKENLVFSDELQGDEMEHFLNSDICFGNIDPTWIGKSEKLKWVQLESVGFAPYIILKEKDYPVITNLKGFFAIPVAETALAGILSLFRGLNELIILKKVKEWEKERVRNNLRTLDGSKVLILGAGSIALHLKKLLSVFKCDVYLFARNNKNYNNYEIDDLNGFLGTADIVIGCLPETLETINLLDNERLSLLPHSAVVVNVGRGSLIDEKALIDKLKNRSLAGAVLDVTQIEPLAKNHPFWNSPNTILTQHTGGGLENENLRKIDFFYTNYSLFIKKEKLINIIDLQKGY